MKYAAGICEASLNILVGQSGIILHDLNLGPPRGQKFNNEFHSDSRIPDDGLSREYLRIQNNTFLPSHNSLRKNADTKTRSIITPILQSDNATSPVRDRSVSFP